MTARRAIRVCHIITSLDLGGAEMMLLKLVRSVNRTKFSFEVISLTGGGPVATLLADEGITVRYATLKGPLAPVRFLRLISWLRSSRPDVVQTWMYHGDVLGGIAARMAGCRRIIWNVRASTLEPEGVGMRTRLLVRLAAVLSRSLPHKIIAVSESARRVHESLGYDSAKTAVIPNGFDTDEFRPDADARREVRDELGIDESAKVIGLIGRYHPMKDHVTFVRAAASYAKHNPRARFILCGPGVSSSESSLTRLISDSGLVDTFRLLGPRHDVRRVMNALDVLTLCSWYGEGFPNVLGEAMSCGVPCVVTPIGASQEIVGDTGYVVSPRDVTALAAAWEKVLGLPVEARRSLGFRARRRIEENFALSHVARRYEQIYEHAVV